MNKQGCYLCGICLFINPYGYFFLIAIAALFHQIKSFNQMMLLRFSLRDLSKTEHNHTSKLFFLILVQPFASVLVNTAIGSVIISKIYTPIPFVLLPVHVIFNVQISAIYFLQRHAFHLLYFHSECHQQQNRMEVKQMNIITLKKIYARIWTLKIIWHSYVSQIGFVYYSAIGFH